jgi:hypothetical protein
MSTNVVLLVFEPSALIETNIHFWREVSRLGQCLLPKPAFTEIKQVIRNSPLSRSPENEKEIAAQFLKFFPASGWKGTELSRAHPKLELVSGHLIARKLRVNLEIAKSAYGAAYLNPHALVVLVTNDQTILQRVNELGQVNLCAATATGVRQWVRTAQAPAAISNATAKMKARNQQLEQTTIAIPKLAETSLAGNSVGKATVVTPIGRSPKTEAEPIRSKRPGRFGFKISWLVGWFAAVAVIVLVWSVLKPAQFNQFWQKRVLPVLPKISLVN